jgi:YD repeat-containing protein
MDLAPSSDPTLDKGPPLPAEVDSGTIAARVVRFAGRHVLGFAAAVAVSFALLYFEATTRRYFDLAPPQATGDPCLTIIRPTTGEGSVAPWTSFGTCPRSFRDPARETVAVDLRYGLLVYYQTEPVLQGGLPLPLTRVQRNLDGAPRAFGRGGNHTYDMGLVGDAAGLTWVDLVLQDGWRVRFRPALAAGWFDTPSSGYFRDSRLHWTGRDWRLHRDDGGQIVFPESAGATSLAQAAPIAMLDADGSTRLRIERDRAGNILSLHVRGGRIDFSHDDANRVTAIDDGSGWRARYEYDDAGCLARRMVAGDGFDYTHDTRSGGCALAAVRHRGRTTLQAEYGPDDRVMRLTVEGSGTFAFAYHEGGSGEVVRVDVTAPDGTLRRVALDESGHFFVRWGRYREPE